MKTINAVVYLSRKNRSIIYTSTYIIQTIINHDETVDEKNKLINI